MELTKARLLSTQLPNRTLWFDGTSSFDPSDIETLVEQYNVKYVDYITSDIELYNRRAAKSDRFIEKSRCDKLSTRWRLPTEYKHIDVISYITDVHYERFKDDPTFDLRERRLMKELLLYKRFDLTDVLRAIIFVINKLTAAGAIWGIGRGSSVSSYVLFVIGVHDVDSFSYELDIDDFLHE